MFATELQSGLKAMTISHPAASWGLSRRPIFSPSVGSRVRRLGSSIRTATWFSPSRSLSVWATRSSIMYSGICSHQGIASISVLIETRRVPSPPSSPPSRRAFSRVSACWLMIFLTSTVNPYWSFDSREKSPCAFSSATSLSSLDLLLMERSISFLRLSRACFSRISSHLPMDPPACDFSMTSVRACSRTRTAAKSRFRTARSNAAVKPSFLALYGRSALMSDASSCTPAEYSAMLENPFTDGLRNRIIEAAAAGGGTILAAAWKRALALTACPRSMPLALPPSR
mmetsp:Transcript_30718/g.42964  ORF Transcript_30718/g.42964 Transcript_30718/m.42964 type:complete len:285 (+) Transcript_30718:1091-1945(+)